MFRLITVLLFFFWSPFAAAQSTGTSVGSVNVERILDRLNEPWGLAFLPDGAVLVTERSGRLLFVSAERQRHSISGVPRVFAQGQGGLLDVMVPRDFAKTREILLSFSKRQRGGSGTALVVARLSQDNKSLSDIRLLFEMSQGSSGGRHFGSRIVEAPDGRIFLTVGERGDRPSAQDLRRHNGSIVRINRDGSIPSDNPFAQNPEAKPEIWSYGHRNPQGAALDLRGQLWVSEHGAKGGDEINRIEKGGNYGWPVISYGEHYSGAKIGEGTSKPGMEQPAHYWDPSIAPSGLMIYSGKLWPEWRGDFFIGSLKFDYISRLDPDRNWTEEVIRSDRTGRVRDIREAPDGSIWFLSVDQGSVFRLAPG